MNEAISTWKKYKDLPPPTSEGLIGEWRIRMDTWWGYAFKNVKVIHILHEGGRGVGGVTRKPVIRIVGHNIAFGRKRWGEFNIRENGVFYYHNRRIVDWLVRVNNDVMKGLYLKDGKPKYTFTMERIDAAKE